jgi:hypothetical protein
MNEFEMREKFRERSSIMRSIIFVLAILALAVSPAFAADYYVATNGNDIYLGGIKYESELFDYRPFKGAISEFTLHARVLSESDIKRIYESAHVK